MKKIMSNLIDFFGKRTNAPPYVQNLKILLLSHEKVYDGVICLKLKKINQKKLKKIKKSKIMKRTLFIVLIMMMMQSGFSQQATINGSSCNNAQNCIEYVCEGEKVELVAGITSGSIDQVVWRQRHSDDLINWTTWTIVGGNNLTIQAPIGVNAVYGRTYQYWLRVKQNGSEYWTFCELRTRPSPATELNVTDMIICAGEFVEFNASSGGTSYVFMVDGVPKKTGSDSFWSTNMLSGSPNVTVKVTSSHGCSAISAPITMTVHSLPSITTISYSSAYSVATAECVNYMVDVTLNGLTGAGPYTVRIYDEVGGNPGTLFYTVPDFVYGSNGTFAKPIYDVGPNTQFFQIEDQNGCFNFPTPTP